MKILPAVAVLQLFLVITDAGSSLPVERKRVACYFYNFMTAKCGSISPEDIPASLCTHLMVDYQFLKMHPDEIEGNWMRTPDIDGNIQKLAKLKEANPDLKLLLQIPHPSEIRRMYGLSPGSPEIKNFTIEYLSILKTIGFDGLDFVILSFVPDLLNELAESFCEIKTEFDKYGFVITTTLMENPFDYFWRSTYETNHSVSNLARCCDHIAFLRSYQDSYPCTRQSSLKRINFIIDLFIKRGLPPSKILITIPAKGTLFHVQRVLQNEQDANGSFTFLGSTFIHRIEVPGMFFHRDIMRIIRNSSLDWIIRRDEETKEPYALTRTTLCASYEDTTSMEFKAKYVLEKGLGGIGIYTIDMEDSEGTTGEGRFPLTRAAYNALSRGLQTVDIATEQT